MRIVFNSCDALRVCIIESGSLACGVSAENVAELLDIPESV